MSTFIGQLIGFVVIVWLLGKFVVPPVRQLMRNQQEAVRLALEESATAAQKLASADVMHAKALEEAKLEAAKVTEEARTDSVRIADQLREQAAIEAERVKAQGDQQVHMLRQQTIRELRQGLGSEALQGADQLVRQYVADPAAQASTVDRFIDGLEAMSPSPAVLEAGASLNLRAASRDALAEIVSTFDRVAGGLDSDGLTSLADELTAVATLLLREPRLARHLAEPTDDTASKDQLVQRLFGGKVGGPTLEVLSKAAALRWSEESNLVDALEHIARLALLVRADRNGEAEEVEEQLFRFGRILDAEPKLTALLSDYNTPADGRVALLRAVLESGGTANKTAEALLAQTIGLIRGERADEAVVDLAELAVARGGEVVAHVSAAAELTAQQRERLAAVLTRIYGTPVSVQLNVDPALLGGLLITVGDEVIDGSISSRLAAARTGLPD